MNIIKSKYIDINNIEFTPPKQYSSGQGYSVKLYYNKKPLYIQTPRLLSLYGLNMYKDDNDNIKSINLVLQFNSNHDKLNRVDNFKIKIKKIDNLISKTANKQRKTWLHILKKLNKDCIDALQKKSLYYSYLQNMEIDNSKPPTFKIKIPYYNNEIQGLILFDENNQKVNYSLSELENKLKGEFLVKCIINPSIYIVNQNFGITYNVKALQLIKKINKNKTKKINKNTIDNYFIDANKLSDNSDNNLTHTSEN